MEPDEARTSSSTPQAVPPQLYRALIDTIERQIHDREVNQDAKILNLYLWGSRVSGTQHEGLSDWDFLAVIENYEQPEQVQATEGEVFHVSGDFIESFDVCIYSDTYFQWLLDQHVPWAIPFLFHPPAATLIKNKEFTFQLEIQRIRRGIKLNTEVNLKQAKSSWVQRNERRRAMKRIFHVFQMIEWSTQIAQFEKIIDRASANKLYRRLNAAVDASRQYIDPKEAWGYFYQIWNPILQELEGNLEEASTFYKSFERDWETQALADGVSARLAAGHILPVNGHGLCAVSFAKELGVMALLKHLSVKVTPSEVDSNLVHLHFSRMFSPADSRIASECNGLVIEKMVDEDDQIFDYLVRSAPMLRFYNHGSDSAPELALSAATDRNTYIHEWSDGRLVTLFHWAGKWRVSSSSNADGSDMVSLGSENSMSIKQLFWRIWKAKEFMLPDESEQNICFTFHLIVADAPIVMQPQEDNIILLSARDLAFAEEVDVFSHEFVKNHRTWNFPERKLISELVTAKEESPQHEHHKRSKSMSLRKLAPEKESLSIDDVVQLAKSTWATKAGWAIRQNIAPVGDTPRYCRVSVLSPMVARLSQFRFASRQQQENILLLLFAEYMYYDHPSLQHCPYPYVDQDSNCCETFDYVKIEFSRFCDEIDEDANQIAEQVGKDRKKFAAVAQEKYPDRSHWLIWSKINASSAREMFANTGTTTAVVCALQKWWTSTHKTERTPANKRFIYKHESED